MARTSGKTLSQPRPPRGNGWQAAKSQRMRQRLLDAATECLIRDGYAQTTTEKIARRAKVSRGAMTHHFRSRAAVLKAAAAHLTEKRAAEFAELVARLKPATQALPTLDDLRQTMRLLHDYYLAPSFIALHELQRAARSDRWLQKMLLPLEAALDTRISDSIRQQFPHWAEIETTREVITDLVHFTLQGVAADPTAYVGSDRLDHLIDLLASVALREFNAAYAARHRR
jgi:AcrR family transcriptional regulator